MNENNSETIINQTENPVNNSPIEKPKAKKKKFPKVLLVLAIVIVVAIVGSMIATNLTPAGKVDKLINNIGTVSLESEEDIIAAETALAELADSDKAKVKNAAILTDARTDFDAIKNVYTLIEDIGTVSLDSADKITDARTAYDKCEETLQAQITNLAILESAEKEYSKLQVNNVIDKINAIGTVTINSKTVIEDAEALFKALSQEQQANVTNAKVLTAARTSFDEIARTEGVALAKSAFGKLKSTYDKVQNITWYEPSERPYYADTRSYVLPYLGVQNGNTWMRLAYWYTGDDWIFWDNVTVMVDGVKYYDFFSYFEVERDNEYGNVWEYCDIEVSDEDLEMLEKIAASNETIVRFSGDNYHYDLTISASDKKAIEKVLTAYEYSEYLE